MKLYQTKKEVQRIFEQHSIFFTAYKDERIHFEYYPSEGEATKIRIVFNEAVEIDKEIMEDACLSSPCFHCKRTYVKNEIWIRKKDGFQRIRLTNNKWVRPFPGFIELTEKTTTDKNKAVLHQDEKKGQIYFLLWWERNLVKIGRSNSPKRRMMELRTQIFGTLRLLKIIETEKPDSDEKELHKRFSCFKVKGEWFDYSDEIKKYIRHSNG